MSRLETDRLRELDRYAVLDTPPEAPFDRITSLAARLFRAPIALVSLVDKDRQWFKSCYGTTLRQTPRDISFCTHAIADTKVLVVPDATCDPRFARSPLVTTNPRVRFYAGAPLVSPAGFPLGTLCIMDTVRREAPSPEQIANLSDLAAMVVDELELRLSERRIGSILESITDGFFALDRNFRFTYLNREAERMLRPGLIGKNLFEEFPHAAGTKFHSMYRLAIERQQPVHFEEYSPRIDAWLEVHAYPAPDSLSVHFRDISQRRLSERGMAQLGAIIESSEDAIVGKTLDGIITSWNASAERIYGYTAEEAMGRPALMLAPEDQRERLTSIYEKLKGGQRIPPFETVRLHKDGTSLHLALSLSPIRDAQANVVGISAIARDITQRKRASEELHHANEMIRAIIQASPVPIFALDLEGNVKFWNPAAGAAVGYRDEETLNRWPPFLRPEDHDDYRELLARYRRGEMLKGVERRRYRPDGTPVDFSLWTAPLRDARNEVIGTIGVALDITERKRLEAQLLHSQKMEAVALLAGGVAHDFNNLLTVIIGYARMLMAELASSDPLRECTEEILYSAERAGALTSQLLAFSRRQIAQPRLIDLNEVVHSMDKMLRRILGEDIDLVTILGAGLGHVRADPGQIEQVIANLAVNARDAMPRGGKLTIETACIELDPLFASSHPGVRPGSYIVLAISDTGSGMTPEVQRHIFEPFFTTKDKGKGTGLGLSIIHGIVKQSGGDIWVYSEPGKGATFKIYLPRAAETAAAAETSSARREVARGTETVLLVEDERPVQKLVREILVKQGYTVLEAANGHEAMELGSAYGGPIQLMMTDVVMPGMTGPDLAEAMRPLRPDMKVLFMSGYTDKAIVQHNVLGAGTCFLQKPFTPEALACRVREVLESS